MASVFNKIAVWGATVDDYGSTSYTISSGNTSGFVAGNLIYAQQINKAFRNATIVPYAIAEMLTGVNVISSFNIGFEIEPASIPAFATSFKSAFNNYIQSAIKVSSASHADTTDAFKSAKTISLSGDISGSASGSNSWNITTTIGQSKILGSMISDAVITSNKIASGAITTSKIADNAITNSKIFNPFISFKNDNYSSSISLGSTLNLYDLFGFNSSTSTGRVKFLSSTLAFVVEPDVEGEEWKIIPNNYTSYNPYITIAQFPYASIVGALAFLGCSNLSEFYGPNVSYILSSAFYGCSNLSTLSLPNVISIGDSAFYGCSNLSTLSLPNVISIEYNAFYGCSNLSTLSLPNVISIRNNAFRGCSNLSTVYIPNIKSISSYAFYSCSSLNTVDAHLTTSINVGAFSASNFDTNVSNIYIDNLSEIPQNCFIQMKNLIKLTKSNNNNELMASSVGAFAFAYCSRLQSISLPNITSIARETFRGCSNLSTLSLPNVISIGDSAFRGCSNLSTLSLPNVISIGDSAFAYCSRLQYISLYNCSSIGNSVFASCSSLSWVKTGKLTSLTQSMFYNCNNLSEVYIEYSDVPLTLYNNNLNYVFESSPMSLSGSGIFYVKTSALRLAYAAASGWSAISSRIVVSSF